MFSTNSTLKMLSVITIVVSISLLIVTSFRLLLPHSYLALLCTYAITISFASVFSGRNCYDSKSRVFIIASIIMFALLLRSLYMLRTNFSIEPLYDGYKDIVVSYLFLKHEHVYIVHEASILTYASSFPALKILAALVANMLGVKVLTSAIFLSLAIGFCMYLTVILFARYFMISLRLKYYFMMLTLMLGSIWPELIYDSIVFYSRNLCLALYCLLMYLIFVSGYLTTGHLSIRYLSIVTILAIALPLSYGYYPALIVTALIIFTILGILLISIAKLKRISILSDANLPLLEFKIKVIIIIVIFLLIGELTVLTYYVARSVLESCRSILDEVLSFWSLWSQEPTVKKQLQAPYWIPPILNDPWNVLVKLRDLATYPPVIVSLLISLFSLIRSILRKDFNTQFMFKLDLLLIIIAYAVAWMMFVGIIQTLINLVIYLLVPLSALAYYYLLSATTTIRQRTIVMILFTVLFTMLVTAGGLSLWSHRVLLKHYYDPSIDFVEAGDHNPVYPHVEYFFRRYVDDTELMNYAIWIDDIEVGRWLLRDWPNLYAHIEYLDRVVNGHKNSLIIVLNEGNLLMKPYGWHSLNLLSLLSHRKKLLREALESFNLIYRNSASSYILLRG